MARIRTIKPEFWTDAKTGTLPEFSKCLFLGLLNHADDFGVLDFDPVGWRAKIFPYHSDNTPGAVREASIHDLLARGLVVLFQIPSEDEGGFRPYIFIKNFARHQVINKPSKPLLTDWKKNDTPSSYARRLGLEHWSIGPREIDALPKPSVSAPGALPLGKERKGKERKGKDSPLLRRGPRRRARHAANRNLRLRSRRGRHKHCPLSNRQTRRKNSTAAAARSSARAQADW